MIDKKCDNFTIAGSTIQHLRRHDVCPCQAGDDLALLREKWLHWCDGGATIGGHLYEARGCRAIERNHTCWFKLLKITVFGSKKSLRSANVISLSLGYVGPDYALKLFAVSWCVTLTFTFKIQFKEPKQNHYLELKSHATSARVAHFLPAHIPGSWCTSRFWDRVVK